MNNYQKPILELIELKTQDVIRTSGEVVGGGIKLSGTNGWGDDNGNWKPVQ